MTHEEYKQTKEDFEKMIGRKASRESLVNFVVTNTSQITTRYDFAFILNAVRIIEYGKDSYHIGRSRLSDILDDIPIERFYSTFYIKKKSGKRREIRAPEKHLKIVLMYINKWLQMLYVPHQCATGFVSGRSVVDNAKLHVGKSYVFNIDLEDFFPSITRNRIFARLRMSDIGCSKYAAALLAKICCCPQNNDNGDWRQWVLPQGAPTSPTLSNIVCEKLDRKLSALARKHRLTYSRYADDITFSSMHHVYRKGSAFRKELAKIIEQEGFRINDGKTRLQTIGERQVVTGLTVNQGINVSKEYIKRLRTILHNWEYSEILAEKRFVKNYTRQHRKGKPAMSESARGMLNYLKMIKGEDDPTYQRLQCRYENCILNND